MPPVSYSRSPFELEVESRFGVLPNFFRSASEAPEFMQQLWIYAKAAYLDNPLPSLFKERLYVHLSRFCASRYCIVRHIGFLLGYGHAAGDATVKVQTVQDVIALLRYPSPTTDELKAAIMHLSSLPSPLEQFPDTGDKNEMALFQVATAIFLSSHASEQAVKALRLSIGVRRTELILGFIAFVRTTHLWATTHPELTIEEELETLLAQQEELAALVLPYDAVEQSEIGQRLYEELQTLRRENKDLAELKAAKAALEERDIQKNKFIALLGHELRNPLAAISAVSEMFRIMNISDQRLRNASSVLHRQTQALARMLDDLLDVSRLTFGKISISKSVLSVDDVLASILRNFEPQFNDKGLTITVGAPSKSAYVLADRTRLTQVFNNILSNALRFTEAPGNISVNTHVDDTHVTIGFTDSGPGFEPTFSKVIFEPFAQAPQDLGRKKGGLGLGLAIASAITKLHDGTLEAYSQGIGKGATFKVCLPLNEQAPGTGTGKAENTPATTRMRVLVIEDNRDFSRLFSDMLEVMGCSINVAFNALAGLEIAKQNPPDLIFCDLALPGDLDGFEFALTVRAEKELRHIPLVAVSGSTHAEDRQRAVNSGFDRICPKPIRFADIRDTLAAFSKSNNTRH